jgi:hypothetical protein
MFMSTVSFSFDAFSPLALIRRHVFLLPVTCLEIVLSLVFGLVAPLKRTTPFRSSRRVRYRPHHYTVWRFWSFIFFFLQFHLPFNLPWLICFCFSFPLYADFRDLFPLISFSGLACRYRDGAAGCSCRFFRWTFPSVALWLSSWHARLEPPIFCMPWTARTRSPCALLLLGLHWFASA